MIFYINFQDGDSTVPADDHHSDDSSTTTVSSSSTTPARKRKVENSLQVLRESIHPIKDMILIDDLKKDADFTNMECGIDRVRRKFKWE
jgi:hypothetical protein